MSLPEPISSDLVDELPIELQLAAQAQMQSILTSISQEDPQAGGKRRARSRSRLRSSRSKTRGKSRSQGKSMRGGRRRKFITKDGSAARMKQITKKLLDTPVLTDTVIYAANAWGLGEKLDHSLVAKVKEDTWKRLRFGLTKTQYAALMGGIVTNVDVLTQDYAAAVKLLVSTVTILTLSLLWSRQKAPAPLPAEVVSILEGDTAPIQFPQTLFTATTRRKVAKGLLFGALGATFMLAIGLAFVISTAANRPEAKVDPALQATLDRAQPSVPLLFSDGFAWPESAPVTNAKALDVKYREFQSAELWMGWNAFTLVKDHPEVCMLSEISWDPDTKQHGSEFRIGVQLLVEGVDNCRRSNKTMLIAPISLRPGKTRGSGHATIAFFNTTSNTLEIFDPNGLVGYASKDNPEGFAVRSFHGALKAVGGTLGFKKVVQSGLPLQEIESRDWYKHGLDGFCEAWIYFYLRIRLLNPHVTPSELNRKISSHMDMAKSDLLLEYIQGSLNRADNLFSAAPRFERCGQRVTLLDTTLHHSQRGQPLFHHRWQRAPQASSNKAVRASYEASLASTPIETSDYLTYWNQVRTDFSKPFERLRSLDAQFKDIREELKKLKGADWQTAYDKLTKVSDLLTDEHDAISRNPSSLHFYHSSDRSWDPPEESFVGGYGGWSNY